MLFWNPIKSTHMTLGLIPEVLDTIDMIMSVCKQFGMVDTKVFKFAHVRDVVPALAVTINMEIINGCFSVNANIKAAAQRAVVPATKYSRNRACFDRLNLLFLIHTPNNINYALSGSAPKKKGSWSISTRIRGFISKTTPTPKS